MQRTSMALALACALPACSDDSPDPIAFGELCGALGPVRVLALAPEQAAYVYPIADRIYDSVYSTDADGLMTVPDNSWSSVGPCGESPRHIADGVTFPLALDRWPDLVFGCVSGTGLATLDPAGVSPPHLTIPTDDPICRLDWSDHGILDYVAIDDTSGSVLLYSIPVDPRRDVAEPEILIESVQKRGLHFGADAIHYLTADATLLRLDLADRSVTQLQTDVRGYLLSADGRYLLWQDSTPTGGDLNSPTGIVSLRDTTSASSVSLGSVQDHIGYYSLSWIDRGYIRYASNSGGRIYRVPGLDPIELPPGAYPDDTGPLPGDRWLLFSYSAPFLRIVDLADGSVTPLFRDQGQIVDVDAENAIILAVPLWYGGTNPYTEEGELWRVPLDGAPARHLLDDASRSNISRLDATRLLVGVDRTPDERVTLQLVDLTTDTARTIADDVTAWSTEPATTILTYSVRDGQNSGIWRARLPAP